jgi:hypothetical protein
MYTDGEIEIINLLSFHTLLKLFDAQFNIHRPLHINTMSFMYRTLTVHSLCSHSLFHLLPRDPYQLDCSPCLSGATFFPTAIIAYVTYSEFGGESYIKVCHILGTQIKSSNQYKYDATIEIKSMEIQVDERND